jgi:hypothetical protein
MLGFTIALLLASGDSAPAGEEYTRGLRLLEEKKHDEAAAAFEGAIRYQPAETPSLKYRNENGRHRHAYHPHFQLGLTRLAQAKGETSLYVRRERLQAAARSFSLTEHPDAAARAAEVATALEATEKLIEETEANTPPPEIGQLRARVDRLCEEQKYEEALAAIGSAGDLFRKFERVKNEMLANVRNRQRATMQSFDLILSGRLDTISRGDPTLEADGILPLLQPARVPPEVTKSPAPRFGWLDGFCALYEKELERIRKAYTLPGAQLIPSAAAFDASAAKALEIGLFNGFRAARNMGHSLRMSRLRELADQAEKPDSTLPGATDFKKETGDLLKAQDEAAARAEADLKKLEGEEFRRYLEKEFATQKRQTEAVRGKVRELTVAYERKLAAEATDRTAEEGLYAADVLANPEACRKLSKPLSVLEAQAYFETLPGPVRARTLYARAVCEAFASLLEAEPASRVAERCRADVLKAFAMDAKVDARWRESGRLSPRVAKIFEDLRQ